MLEMLLETPRTWMLLRHLRANVYGSLDALRLLQDKLLLAAVHHAYENVPFYTWFWNETGFDARRFRGIQDLERIPIAGNELVKEAGRKGRLLANRVDTSACTYLDSSGSSGNPLRIWRGPVEDRVRRAVGLRIWFEHGFSWRDRTTQFQILPGPQHPLQRFGISRKVWISTALPIERQLTQFLESKADVVAGTPTALRRIAYAVEASGEKAAKPRIVFGAGELIDDETRGIVRRVFEIDPVGLYGQTEVGYVGWQCERRDLFHANADTHLVEVRSNGRQAAAGELGTVVVTDLRTMTMPFIRYDTKDLARAAAGTCDCGRQLSLLGAVEGRASGCFTLRDGRILTTRDIVNHMAGTVRLGAYRLYQDSADSFRVQLVSSGDGGNGHCGSSMAGQEAQGAVSKRLRELLGNVNLSFETVGPWQPDGTGKTHTVFSAVPIAGLSGH
jgi:phenylacetate-CoA ligase